MKCDLWHKFEDLEEKGDLLIELINECRTAPAKPNLLNILLGHWCLNVECVILALIATKNVQFYQTNCQLGNSPNQQNNGLYCDKAH